MHISLCFSGSLCRNYRNCALVFSTGFENNGTIYQGVQSVVATHTDVFTGVELSTSLTNDDIACLASLTTENLNA